MSGGDSVGCPVHGGAVHGGEADELRAGIEALIAQYIDGAVPCRKLQALLDRVDARDSLGHLERGIDLDALSAELDAAHQAGAALVAERDAAITVGAELTGERDRLAELVAMYEAANARLLAGWVEDGRRIAALTADRDAHAARAVELAEQLTAMERERDALRLSARAARDDRQAQIFAWTQAAFSVEQATSLPQRGLRLLEETIEAYQAVGGDPAMAHRLIDFVFARPAGELHQELGGVGVCVLALASAAGLSADAEERRETDRVLVKPIDEFRQRNAAKNAAGFLAPVAKAAP